jgi:exodeoxyribonuclease-3
MKLVSWNVNGLRAAHKKGLTQWLYREKPDVLCLQETKANPQQVPLELRYPEGYHAYFNSAQRPGYSGVSVLTNQEPKSVTLGFAQPKFDSEGRVLAADFGSFILFNVYFPNGGASVERLNYKLEFYDSFMQHLAKLRDQGKGIVVCGDYNTAHKEIDIARPKENENNSGFMHVERERLDRLIDIGFIDTFRMFNSEGGQYTWWDMKTRARERNVGWRLDYFFVSDELKARVASAAIHPGVMGSDHCPVSLELMD